MVVVAVFVVVAAAAVVAVVEAGAIVQVEVRVVVGLVSGRVPRPASEKRRGVKETRETFLWLLQLLSMFGHLFDLFGLIMFFGCTRFSCKMLQRPTHIKHL